MDRQRANDRTRRFVIDGMAENAKDFDSAGVLRYPYSKPEPHAGQVLLEVVAADACPVVTGDHAAFFPPRMTEAAAKKMPTRLGAVYANGLLP